MKNILITGCSRGIGFSAVKLFVRDSDVNIFAISRNKEGLLKLKKECRLINKNSNIYTFSYDLSDLSKINKITNDITSNLNGDLDGLINNAGFLVKKKFTQISIKELENSFKINCFAPFLLIQNLMPFFAKNAHILSISSMGGFQDSKKFPGLSVYSTSKSTLITLTQCLAEEFKTTGLTFNCLALGAVQTEMLNQAFPGYKAPMNADKMAQFIVDFYFKGSCYFNGQVLPVSLTIP